MISVWEGHILKITGYTHRSQGSGNTEGTGENVNKNLDCGFHAMEWMRQGQQA